MSANEKMVIIGFFVVIVLIAAVVWYQENKKKIEYIPVKEPTVIANTPIPTASLGIGSVQPTAQPTAQPTLDLKNIKELMLQDIKEGTGEAVITGKKVTVNYNGYLIDGTKFDSSYDKGTPFTFSLGSGEVIKGWDQGVVGMKIGGMRRLIIPSTLGYAEKGAGDVIPPNATLVFEIELLKIE